MKKIKDRHFLQYIGTEWGRALDPNVWIKIAIENTPSHGNVFISDLRFPNEFYALKTEGWICVKIERDVKTERVGSGSMTHSSEYGCEHIQWDYIISNNGTLEEFYKDLDILVKFIFNQI